MMHLVPMWEETVAQQAQDHDTGPPGPYSVRAGGPVLRHPASSVAGLLQDRHCDRDGDQSYTNVRQTISVHRH